MGDEIFVENIIFVEKELIAIDFENKTKNEYGRILISLDDFMKKFCTSYALRPEVPDKV